MFDHEEPLDAEAERKSAEFLRIDITVSENVGVHHAAADDFQPATGAFFGLPAHVELESRFHEWEVSCAESKVDVVSHESLQRRFHDRLHVRETHVFSYHQPLELVEHGRVGGIRVFSVGLPRTDHPERRRMGAHVADLDG